ncbi:MAG: cysteine desulfurase family protein [Collinsella sp.]|nr:cysteine desulfurase family protein [Collinsella sp.]
MTFSPDPSRRPVNLDYAASTPLRPEAIEAQRAYDESALAGVNPNSLHSLGRLAQAELERCRERIARSLGSSVRSSEIIFTGGGTEAGFLALMGLSEAARERSRSRDRVIISSIEHDSILDNGTFLRRSGFTVDLVAPERDGRIDPERLGELMGDDVALVSIMLANNETGAIQPIKELVEVAHAHDALFHTDAVQGWLHTPFDVADLGVDALSVAGHKIGGPVGVGALYVRNRVPIRPRSLGGGQERGLRPGTQDLRAIVGFAAAVDAIAPTVAEERDRLMRLSDALYARLLSSPRIRPSIEPIETTPRLPGIVSVVVEGIDSEELILKLDVAGFEVSAGSACSSGSMDASHVLLAMGIPRDWALGSLRISFDDRVDEDALEAFPHALLKIIGEPC